MDSGLPHTGVGCDKEAPVTFAAICLLAWVLTFILNRLWFQESIKRKDDLIADRDKKLAGLPSPAEHGIGSQLLLRQKEQTEELAQARKDTQDAVAALAGKRQHFREVERYRDKYQKELAEAKEQIEKLQEIRTERDSLKSELDELTRFKIVPMVDIEPHHSNTGHRIHSAVFIAYDALDVGTPPDKLLLKVDLRLRFDNQDPAIAGIRGLVVLLRRETEQGETREARLKFLAREEDSRAKVNLNGLAVQPAQLTPYYRLECEAELDKGWAKMLDEDCFLRIVMEANQQPRYCVDLNVDWATARLTDSLADLTLRSSGRCF